MKQIFFLLTVSFLISCSSLKRLSNLGNDIKEVGKNLEAGAGALAKGIDNVGDIAGLRSQYRDNKELRETINKLRQQLIAVTTGLPEVSLADEMLRFRIDSYQGQFKVNVYIDQPTNSIWVSKEFRQNEVRHLNVDYQNVLSRNFRVADVASAPTFSNNLTPMIAPIPESNAIVRYRDRGTLFPSGWNFNLRDFNFTAYGEKIKSSMKEAVDEAFVQYLAQGLPGISLQVVDLNPKLNTVGEHVIVVEIIPERADAQGKLNITGRFYTETANKQIKEIGSFTFSSEHQEVKGASYNTNLTLGEVAEHKYSIKVK